MLATQDSGLIVPVSSRDFCWDFLVLGCVDSKGPGAGGEGDAGAGAGASGPGARASGSDAGGGGYQRTTLQRFINYVSTAASSLYSSYNTVA